MTAVATLPRAVRRRLKTDRTFRRWAVAWLGGSVLGIANGVIRETIYKERVGDLTGDQISGATLVALLTLYFWALERRWPIGTTRAALEIGAAWVAFTVIFEFGFGRYVDGQSWSELLENYNLAGGNLWLLVLAWTGIGPVAVRAIRRR